MASVLSVCRCGAQPSGWCSTLRRGRVPHRLVGETGDATEAARLLGVHRNTLQQKVAKWSLRRPGSEP